MPDFARVFRACVLCFAGFFRARAQSFARILLASALRIAQFFAFRLCTPHRCSASSLFASHGPSTQKLCPFHEGHVGAVSCLSLQRNGRFPVKPCDEGHVGAVFCLSSQEIKPEMLCCFDCRLLSGQLFEAGEIIMVSPRMTASLKPASSIAFRPLSVRPFGVVTRWISSSGSD